MLIASVPRQDQHWEKVGVEVERNPRLFNVTHGCVYYDRFPVVDVYLGRGDIQPEPVEVESGHFVAYYRAVSG